MKTKLLEYKLSRKIKSLEKIKHKMIELDPESDEFDSKMMDCESLQYEIEIMELALKTMNFMGKECGEHISEVYNVISEHAY